MTKYKIVPLLCLFAFLASAANDTSMVKKGVLPDIRKHSIFIELGGQGQIATLNYEFRRNRITYRAGVYYFFSKKFTGYGGRRLRDLNGMVTGVQTIPPFSFPIEGTYLFGGQKNFIEVGIGITYIRGWFVETEIFDRDQYLVADRNYLQSIYFTPRVGYRYSSENEFIFFRIGLTPIFHIYEFDEKELGDNYASEKILEENKFRLRVGVSVGYTF